MAKITHPDDITISERLQISEYGESKFLINDAKRSVFIKNLKEMDILSEYIKLDIQAYLKDYNPLSDYDVSMERVFSCKARLSLSETHFNDFGSKMNSTATGIPVIELWNTAKHNSITLDAFMNPEKYPGVLDMKNLRYDSLGQIIEKGAEVLFFEIGVGMMFKGLVTETDLDNSEWISVQFQKEFRSVNTGMLKTETRFSQVAPNTMIVLDNIKKTMPELFI